MRIKTDYPATSKDAVNLEYIQRIYPVGSLYLSTLSTNPSDLLGFGTWARFGEGKVMIGQSDSDADFDTAEETGGSKTNTHNHFQTVSFDGGGLYVTKTGISPRSRVESKSHMTPIGASATTGDTREDSTYNETIDIVPPFIVVYTWKRTA